MIIIGVDPGKMTGWAMYDTGTDTFESWQADRNIFVDTIIPHLQTYSGFHLAVESFVLTAGTMRTSRGDENYSIEQIGILRHWARRFGHHFELQTSGNMKKFATPDKLKTAGWWTPNQGHANDAAGHVLLYVARRDVKLLDRLLTTE